MPLLRPLALSALATLTLLLACTDNVLQTPQRRDRDDDDDTELDGSTANDDGSASQGDGSNGPDGSQPVPDAAPLTAFSVATYNTHLFFDTTCNSDNCGPGDFERVLTQTQFRNKVADLADAIVRLDADVVTLQEVETEGCLQALVDALAERNKPYPVAIHGEIGAPGSIDVAVLARGELVETIRHRGNTIPLPGGGTTRFTREFLEVHLTHAGAPVVVFATHFKSKNDDDMARRLAEANAARDLVVAAQNTSPQALVVMGGDLNDVPGSEPLDALEQGGSLRRLAADVSASEQYTYYYQGQGQAIDHVYATAASASRYLPGSAEVLRDGARDGLGGSDHAALRVRFADQ